MDVQAVYRIDPDQPDGSHTVTRIISDIKRPNGIVVSPDQSRLYVIESWPENNNVWAYALNPDGSVGNRFLFYSFGYGRGGDGMCIDSQGNLYVVSQTFGH